MSNFFIDYYRKDNNETPVADFIDTLSPKSQVRVSDVIDLLQELGNMLRRPHCDYLRDGIYELRIHTIEGQIRILYCFCGNKIILLTHGFIKKTKKVPDSEIDRAIRYKDDYVSKKEGN